MGVQGSMFPCISTKVTGVHGFTSTGNSMVKVLVQWRTNAHDKCGRYESKQGIGTDVVGKVRKGVMYYDSLQQGS